jgi:spermidine synthase
MRLSDPVSLELAYIRDMMAWLLFLEPPPRILQLGLGAASLTKFCHRHCRGSAITVVENSRVVIEAAHQWFKLPQAGPGLAVVRADAGAYVARPRARGQFGVVQVDLYDRDAAGPVLDSERFYGHCHAALAEPGVMAVNLFGRHASFSRSLRRIRAVFDEVIPLDPREEGNLVVLAFKGPPLRVSRKDLMARAGTIQSRYALPAKRWARSVQTALAVS